MMDGRRGVARVAHAWRASLAAAVVAAAVVGCSAGAPAMVVDEGAAPSTTSDTSSDPGTPSPSTAGTGDEAHDPSDREPSTGPGSGDPEKEKEYVDEEGAPGIDPGAVLEGGYATCDRLARAAGVERSAAVEAVALGQLPRVWTAVPALCPELTSVLDAARGGFPDGTYDVVDGPGGAGTVDDDDVPGAVGRGTYRPHADGKDCRWTVEDDDGGVVAEGGVDSDALMMTLGATASRVTTSGCLVWLPTKGDG